MNHALDAVAYYGAGKFRSKQAKFGDKKNNLPDIVTSPSSVSRAIFGIEIISSRSRI